MSNPVQINMYGIRYFIDGDLSDPHVKKLMVQARNDLQQMKNRNINNIPHIWLDKPNAYKIVSQFGIDSAYINVPVFKKRGFREIEIKKKEEKPRINVYLTPALETYGDKDGVFTQLGYAICSPGTWGPPYKHIETDNIIDDWLDREEAAEARSANPNITVDPFFWPAWVTYTGYDYDHPEDPDRLAAKPFDGTLQNREIYCGVPAGNGWDGETEVTLFEFASTFEEYYYDPMDGTIDNWDLYSPDQFDEALADWLDDPVLWTIKGASCYGFPEGQFYANVTGRLKRYWAGQRRTFPDYLWKTIGNVEVPNTRYLSYDYLFNVYQHYVSCGAPFIAATGTNHQAYADLGAMWDYMQCLIEEWFADYPNCTESGITGCAEGGLPKLASDCTCDDISGEMDDRNSCNIALSPVVPDPLGSYSMQPYDYCDLDRFDYYNKETAGWGNCKDISNHVFWHSFSEYFYSNETRKDIATVVDGTVWGSDCGWQDAVDPGYFDYYPTTSIGEASYNNYISIVVNNRWFTWAESLDQDSTDLKEKNLAKVYSRYYKLDEAGDNFWVLITAHNIHTECTYPDYDVPPNRRLCMIYKSSDPERLDIEPGEDSQCIEFDTLGTSGNKFVIPGILSPDGGEVWSYGTFRLFQVTETKEPIRTEQIEKFRIEE